MMSAFVCSTSDFATIATFAIRHGVGGVNRSKSARTLARVANVLGAENVRSVNHRYAHNKDAQSTYILLTGAEVRAAARDVTPAQLVKLCDCLKYQSCETPDYERTEAGQLLAVIRAKACSLAGFPLDYSEYSGRPEYGKAASWGLPHVEPVNQMGAALPSTEMEF